MLTNVEFFSKKTVICLNWQGKIRIKRIFIKKSVIFLDWHGQTRIKRNTEISSWSFRALVYSPQEQWRPWSSVLVFIALISYRKTENSIRARLPLRLAIITITPSFTWCWSYNWISNFTHIFPLAKNFLKESDPEKKVNSSKVSEYGKFFTDCPKSDHLKKQADYSGSEYNFLYEQLSQNSLTPLPYTSCGTVAQTAA